MLGLAGGLLVVGSGFGRRVGRRIRIDRRAEWWFGFLGGLVLGGLVIGLGWWTAVAFLAAILVGPWFLEGIDRRRVARWSAHP